MDMQKYLVDDAVALVRAAYWLAWQACGGTLGAGVLQDRPTATADDVWSGIMNASDYLGDYDGRIARAAAQGDFYADYVFGRMMKLTIYIRDGAVVTSTDTPRPAYQAWCRKYPTYDALIVAAAESENVQAPKGDTMSWAELRQ